ncbi:MAG: RNA methyltransferase [Betaproteobacteria bacterium]|nr:RNA methyltransferase [Betaproteobacteria bacterium]
MNPPVQTITSRDNELLQRLRRLSAKPGAYRAEGLIWLEGDHLCRAWLDRGRQALQAVITQEAWEARADLRALALGAQRVAVIPALLMKAVTSLESPSPLGLLVAPPLAAACSAQPGVPTVVLDRLQDPGNVGSILRSAAALGVRQVLALQGGVALWSPKVLRAGMGAHFGLALREGLSVQDLQYLAPQLVVTTSHQAQDLQAAALPDACAWVFGHEGQGVDSELCAMARYRVCIPQPGGQESLNVAAAAAICLYEAARRLAQ